MSVSYTHLDVYKRQGCWYPSPEELPAIPYRSKKALAWPVRIVEIPGYDCCACCGTHVAATGEIGLIKLLSAVSFRGGTRIEMACGSQALALSLIHISVAVLIRGL